MVGDNIDPQIININYANMQLYKNSKDKIVELYKSLFNVISHKAKELPDGRIQLKIYVK